MVAAGGAVDGMEGGCLLGAVQPKMEHMNGARSEVQVQQLPGAPCIIGPAFLPNLCTLMCVSPAVCRALLPTGGPAEPTEAL